jgi:DNA primase
LLWKDRGIHSFWGEVLKDSIDRYQSAKEEIKRAVDIVELISQFVQLKRAGQNYVGLCPFHSEKAPSFSVSPGKQMFHCFGCKKGGDLFAFWMAYHQVSFPQAVKDLADKYHISLPETHSGTSGRAEAVRKEALLRVNETAARFFHRLLIQSDKGKPGRAYFESRSIPVSVIEEFRLGYATDEWNGLGNFFRETKVDLKTAMEAGLLIPKKAGGYYDRFRGRVIFPIFDMRNHVVGFGGRVLDQSLPKYLNTPETPLFQKGELLYGLHVAHEVIRKTGRAVIVEGYTDVLALMKHGFRGAVATLGTALTREHIRKLKGYAEEAVLVFDPDAAGMAAAVRSLPLFLNEGMSSKVLLLPKGEDPDAFVNRNGIEPFAALLDRSVPTFDFFLDMKLSVTGATIEGRSNAGKEVIDLLLDLTNELQRSLYVRRLSERLGVPESSVLKEMEKERRLRSMRVQRNPLLERSSEQGVRVSDDVFFLNVVAHHPHCIERLVKLDLKSLLSDPPAVEIFDSLAKNSKEQKDFNIEEMLEELPGEPAKQALREAMVSPSRFQDEEVLGILRDFEERIKLKASTARAKAKGDIESYNKILKLKRQRDVQPIMKGNSQEGM